MSWDSDVITHSFGRCSSATVACCGAPHSSTEWLPRATAAHEPPTRAPPIAARAGQHLRPSTWLAQCRCSGQAPPQATGFLSWRYGQRWWEGVGRKARKVATWRRWRSLGGWWVTARGGCFWCWQFRRYTRPTPTRSWSCAQSPRALPETTTPTRHKHSYKAKR